MLNAGVLARARKRAERGARLHERQQQQAPTAAAERHASKQRSWTLRPAQDGKALSAGPPAALEGGAEWKLYRRQVGRARADVLGRRTCAFACKWLCLQARRSVALPCLARA